MTVTKILLKIRWFLILPHFHHMVFLLWQRNPTSFVLCPDDITPRCDIESWCNGGCTHDFTGKSANQSVVFSKHQHHQKPEVIQTCFIPPKLAQIFFNSLYYLKWIDKGHWKTSAFSSCFYWPRILESWNGWSHSFRLLLAKHEGQRPCVLVRNWCTQRLLKKPWNQVRSTIPREPRKNSWGHEDKHAYQHCGAILWEPTRLQNFASRLDWLPTKRVKRNLNKGMLIVDW